jgi:hypothetical protein
MNFGWYFQVKRRKAKANRCSIPIVALFFLSAVWPEIAGLPKAQAGTVHETNLTFSRPDLSIQSETDRKGSSAGIHLDAAFDNDEFVHDLFGSLHKRGTVLSIGIEPTGSCSANVSPVPPIQLSLFGATYKHSSDATSFELTNDLGGGERSTATLKISRTQSNDNGSEQTVTLSCPGGGSVTLRSSGGVSSSSAWCKSAAQGGAIFSSSQSIGRITSGSGDHTQHLELSIKMESTKAIPAPMRAVDLFVRYPSSSESVGNPRDKTGCATLNSTSVSSFTRVVHGQKKAFYSFVAQ